MESPPPTEVQQGCHQTNQRQCHAEEAHESDERLLERNASGVVFCWRLSKAAKNLKYLISWMQKPIKSELPTIYLFVQQFATLHLVLGMNQLTSESAAVLFFPRLIYAVRLWGPAGHTQS